MPRSYRRIKQYEEEIVKLREKGMTLREIGEKFGLTYKLYVAKGFAVAIQNNRG